jgi:hypothetical protein
MKPIETITKESIKPQQLLLEVKQTPTEVKEYKERLSLYGIKNSTRKKIEEHELQKKDQERTVLKEKAINILIDAFTPFNIVSYATLDAVCKDHKLVISGLPMYDKPIPDENLNELDNFVEGMKTIDESLLTKINVAKNNYFTFDSNGNARQMLMYPKQSNYFNRHDKEITREPGICTSKMFKIAAPDTHFKFPEDSIRVGNEIHRGRVSPPKFKFEFKINKPNYDLDPIIFMPTFFMGKALCIIITAWDKVADDSRILSKI